MIIASSRIRVPAADWKPEWNRSAKDESQPKSMISHHDVSILISD